jgi:hypothetical protein
MVNKDPHLISFIKHPTHTVQLAAVKRNGHALKYIRYIASSDVQLAAVEKDGYAIEYIKNPSEELQIIAVKSSPMSIEMIKHPSAAVQKAAITTNSAAIAAIEDHIPDEIIHDCKHAIIKGILTCMKEGKFEYIEYILNLLSKYTLDWPELDTIKRSYEHEINRRS